MALTIIHFLKGEISWNLLMENQHAQNAEVLLMLYFHQKKGWHIV